ncbi:UDP-glucuronosyltransferase 1-7C [Armadillidium nasatum]|uniref:UDP-glucuronosyltransferase 1-7C n=1 Tax=Armadillidium nasatum TaxID=96803 RepID=A0A5N5TFV4_9CRUS|nr:UDP-glucuronosyltransferase 1-7C [Armadillidium nasatum]
MGVAEALAKRGHQVTMVSMYEPTKKIENIREVVIQNVSLDSMLVNIFEDNDVVASIFKEMSTICFKALDQPQIQALKNEKFDLIILSIFFNYCFLSFIHHFKVPFIYISPAGLIGSMNDMVGNIDFPGIVGTKFLQPTFPLTFKQRLATTLMNEYMTKVSEYYLLPKMYSMCIEKGLCDPDTPPFSEFDKNASLIIINSIRAIEYPPRPTNPNVIYAGGIHLKPPKKLPKDLEDWVQGSGEEGFIFFSLGSALNPDFLPEKYRQILVKVFGSLKQRVLWKWNEETMPDLPSNVKLQKWLPQADLLGHPKIKLFITHGGLLSTLESTYNGVPVIGMPVFADQESNMMDVQNEGWGRLIMVEIVKQKSLLMKDRLVPPEEEAVYWVEYVMRHNGAPHIRSPVFMMKWYEVYNIDVWAFIIFVIVGTLKCFGIGKSKNDKRKKE